MRPILRQPSAVVKLIAFINVVWLLVLLSLEVILVYEYDDKGLRDIIPSLMPSAIVNELDHPHRNRSSYKQCTYHIYRKYACVLVAVTPTTSTPVTGNGSSDSFLPLLWFSVCCVDILISFVLYRAAEQKRPRLALIWLWLGGAALCFQLIILAMFSFAAFSEWFWHESPLIGFCVFRLYSLYVVHKFYTSLLELQRTSSLASMNKDHPSELGMTTPRPPPRNASSEMHTNAHISASADIQYNSSSSSVHRTHVHSGTGTPSNEYSPADCGRGRGAGGCGHNDKAGALAPGLKIRKLSQVRMGTGTITADSLPTLIFKS